jgi:hypothetical protein
MSGLERILAAMASGENIPGHIADFLDPKG